LVSESAAPVAFGLAAGSSCFIAVLLGENWTDGAVSLSLLSIAGFFMAMTAPAATVFLSVGKPQLILKITLLFLLLMVPSVFVGADYLGMMGVALVVLAHESCKCVYVLLATSRLVDLESREIFVGLSHSLLSAGLMATGILILALTFTPSLTLLVIMVIIALTIYVPVESYLSHGKLLQDFRDGLHMMRPTRQGP
jgi:PST family polysaccharide transporter